MYKTHFKNSLDFCLAVFILIVTLPIFLIICIILYLLNHGRVFYLQERATQNLRSFKLIKFVTMSDEHDPHGKLLPDLKRISIFGKILRYTSLDELPNLINVIKGDMSLIGPRPLPVKYIIKMSSLQLKRYSVKAGITGLAQVSGRNKLTLKQKIELDLFYIEKISFKFDFQIFIATFKVLFSREVNFELGNKSIDDYEPKINLT